MTFNQEGSFSKRQQRRLCLSWESWHFLMFQFYPRPILQDVITVVLVVAQGIARTLVPDVVVDVKLTVMEHAKVVATDSAVEIVTLHVPVAVQEVLQDDINLKYFSYNEF